jgi:hypothetical protein
MYLTSLNGLLVPKEWDDSLSYQELKIEIENQNKKGR